MTNRHAILTTVLAIAGSLHALPMPRWPCVALAVIGFAGRRPILFATAIGLLCSSLSFSAWSGVVAGPPRPIEGPATVVTDPVSRASATQAVVRIGGRRFLARGWGPLGAELARTQVGDRIAITATTRPYRGSRERQAAWHVGESLSLRSLRVERNAGGIFGVANALRDLISEGASSMGRERRALLTGLVYGDDRNQSPLTEADFRAAGLTHLLAVSGQNVAYVLTLTRPLLQRLSPGLRLLATVAVLILFAAVTRFEPSVLRATLMASLAVTARWLGREAESGRLLCLAVAGLLVIDPLLASSIAFRLSVAASAGIVWLRPHVAARVRGPTIIVDTVAITVAAQLAVAPLLITTFGPVSVVSIPANLIAAPVAGVAMSWGMTAGIVAGVAPPAVAATIHRGSGVLLWALESIASAAANAPVAPVGLRWLGLAVGTWWALGRIHHHRARRAVLACAGLVLTCALLPLPKLGRIPVGPTSELISTRHGAVLDLHDPPDTITWLLDDLRAARVRHLAVVVVTSEGAEHTATALGRRVRVDTIVRPGPELRVITLGPVRMSLVTTNERASITW